MKKAGVFSYKYRLIYSLIGFFLLYLMTPPVLLFQSVGAYSLSSLIITIMLAPAYPLPEEGPLVVLLVMFFWGSVGFYLGYVKDRFNVSKVKRIKRSDKNMQITNPYIDRIIKNPGNKSKKRGYTPGDVFRIAAHLLIILFIGAVLFSTFRPDLLRRYVVGYPERPSCSKVETDAQNTLAALASYFSEPEHTKVPTVQDLVNEEGLTLNKNSTVIIDGPKDEIRVTVIEKKNSCPRGNKFEVYVGGTAGEWYRE